MLNKNTLSVLVETFENSTKQTNQSKLEKNPQGR